MTVPLLFLHFLTKIHFSFIFTRFLLDKLSFTVIILTSQPFKTKVYMFFLQIFQRNYTEKDDKKNF